MFTHLEHILSKLGWSGHVAGTHSTNVIPWNRFSLLSDKIRFCKIMKKRTLKLYIYPKDIIPNYQWDYRRREQAGRFQSLLGLPGIPTCQTSPHHFYCFHFEFECYYQLFRYFNVSNKSAQFLLFSFWIWMFLLVVQVFQRVKGVPTIPIVFFFYQLFKYSKVSKESAQIMCYRC